jgi:ankyrin repeat protein
MNSIMKNLMLILFIHLAGMTCYGQELTNEIAWIIKYGQKEQLEKLTASGSINECIGVEGGKKYNYLAISIKLKSMESLRYFIEKGANIEGVCADKTPLMYAAKYGQLEMAKYLIKKGADVNAKYKGKTALSFARQYHHPDLVMFLKEEKNNLDPGL